MRGGIMASEKVEIVKREWHGGRGDVTILHMNILAESLALLPCVESSVCAFPHVRRPEVVFGRERRHRLLVEVLEEHRPDVMCLAEVDEQQFNDLVATLGAWGYVGLYKRKEASDARDGSAIFYAHDGMRCVAVEVFAVRPPESQVCVAACFCVGPSQKAFIVAATHLKAKAGFEERRKEQCMAVLQRVTAFRRAVAGPDTPVFLAGDLNDVRGSPCIKYIRRHALGLEDAYATVYGRGDERYYTTYKKRDVAVRRAIDYIFYQTALTRCVGLALVPPASAFPELLPAVDYPSDHLAVVASFELGGQ